MSLQAIIRLKKKYGHWPFKLPFTLYIPYICLHTYFNKFNNPMLTTLFKDLFCLVVKKYQSSRFKYFDKAL